MYRSFFGGASRKPEEKPVEVEKENHQVEQTKTIQTDKCEESDEDDDDILPGMMIHVSFIH